MSIFSALSSAVSYVVGGDADGSDTNDTFEQNETKSQMYEYDSDSIIASCNGELWKFHKKREEFQLVIDNVTVLIVQRDPSQYACSFQVLKHDGTCLFAEDIDNTLQIQYNRREHTMIWTMWDEDRDRVNVLSFRFYDPQEENSFKTTMSIKLYEFNRGESFDTLVRREGLKDEDREWVGESLENEPNEPDDYQETDDLVLIDEIIPTEPMDVDENIDEQDWGLVWGPTTRAYDSDDYDSEDPNEPDEIPRGVDRWEDANSTPPRVPYNQSSSYDAINTSPFEQRSPNTINRHITGSKCFNRTYVVRDTDEGSMLGLYKHDEDNELNYLGKLALKDFDNLHITPRKILQHKGDRKLLMLSERKPSTISVMDLERGSVVQEWNAKPDSTVTDITNLTKHGQCDDIQMALGLSNKSMFLMDARVPDQVVEEFSYKTNPKMETIATSGQGFMATGSATGQIRMYNQLGKRAKTLLPGLGDAIKYIETTDDGEWILATCQDYLMVIPTRVPDTDRLGFEGRGMGKKKPKPYVLRLRPVDIVKYKLHDLNFTPAHFDCGSDISEHWIVTSTGNFIIKWNFRKLKRNGNVNSYSIRQAQSKIVHNEFRFNYGDELLVSEADSVYAQHARRKNQ